MCSSLWNEKDDRGRLFPASGDDLYQWVLHSGFSFQLICTHTEKHLNLPPTFQKGRRCSITSPRLHRAELNCVMLREREILPSNGNCFPVWAGCTVSLLPVSVPARKGKWVGKRDYPQSLRLVFRTLLVFPHSAIRIYIWPWKPEKWDKVPFPLLIMPVATILSYTIQPES